MSDPRAALVRLGVDAEQVEVQERGILGPHLFVDCGDYVLSIVGEIDTAAMVRTAGTRDPQAPLPLRSDVLEIGLLEPGRAYLLAEPLRYVPFEAAAALCRLALAGDVSAFEDRYDRDEGGEQA